MLFNTLEYFLFFVFVLAVSWLTSGWTRFRTWFLIVASLYFYTSNNSWQVLLLVTTTTVDYFASLAMSRSKDERFRKLMLIMSVTSNLGMLAYFKYFNFFGQSVASFAGWLGWRPDWVDVNILLPVGISFYTFEALSYTIDVYRRKIPAERDYARLAFLVSFFPHLIAGPIVRAADFFPQIGRPPSMTVKNLELAVYLIAIGLFKKIVLADGLAAPCRRRLHQTGRDRHNSHLDRRLRFRLSDLLRLLRLHRYRAGQRKAARLRVAAQFQPALCRHQHHRFLAPLAHEPVDLAARLSLHFAGRQ